MCQLSLEVLVSAVLVLSCRQTDRITEADQPGVEKMVLTFKLLKQKPQKVDFFGF